MGGCLSRRRGFQAELCFSTGNYSSASINRLEARARTGASGREDSSV
jgi:hypothetical protein